MIGGNGVTGTVTLTAPAPAGGVVVALSSNNTLLVTVPATVTVPAGQTSATFPCGTNLLTGLLDVLINISASLNGTVQVAALTVKP